MNIDLHVHTRHYSGCSVIEAGELIEKAKEAGLDGLVLTEHGILWRQEVLAPLQEEASGEGLVILAGQEVTCFHEGMREDFLVFGIAHSLGSGPSAEDLIRTVHGEGGVVVAAHPMKPPRWSVGGWDQAVERLARLPLDALELYHPDHDERARRKIRRLACLHGFALTGGSDAHEPQQVGAFATRFFRRVRTIEELVEEIRAGRIEPVDGRRGRKIKSALG
jgi:hypothetical protein